MECMPMAHRLPLQLLSALQRPMIPGNSIRAPGVLVTCQRMGHSQCVPRYVTVAGSAWLVTVNPGRNLADTVTPAIEYVLHFKPKPSLRNSDHILMGKRKPLRLPDDESRVSKRILLHGHCNRHEPPSFAGVDVGGVRKGFHLAVLRGQTIESIERLADPALVASRCREMNAAAVAVDAPCGWSASGRSREAERAMLRHGIRAYNVPARDLAQLHGFHAWMLQGEAAYSAMQPHFTLWTSSACPSEAPFCFETFPHAITCALLGRIVRGQDKSTDRLAALATAGIRLPERPLSQDDIDACICALAAQLVANGDAQAFGQKHEGFIVIPQFRGALSKGRVTA